MVTRCGRPIGAWPEMTGKREHLDSLNFSLQLVLHMDGAQQNAVMWGVYSYVYKTLVE